MNVREAAKVRNRLTTWYVDSEMDLTRDPYIVHNKRNEITHRKSWTCNCLDFTERQMYRGGICKHIQAVQNFLSLQAAKELTAKIVGGPVQGVGDILSALMAGFAGKDGLVLWNLVSFLRGPDTINSYLLKNKTTAVLRAKLGMQKGLVDTNFNDEPFGIEILRSFHDVYQHKYEFLDKLRKALHENFNSDGAGVVTEHFVLHYAEALIAAYKLGYIK